MTTALRSNSVEIPFTDTYFGSLESLDASASPAALRRHLAEDGYVMVRQWLDADRVREVRAAYLSDCPPGLFKPGTALVDGIYSGHYPEELPHYGLQGHPAHAFVRSEAFLSFADDPRLLELAEILVGGPVVRLRRTPFRHFVRDRAIASRAHVDHTFLDQGSADMVTFWVPLGECPLTAGGLIYLEDSVGLDTRALEDRLPHDRSEDRRHLTHDLKALSDLTGKKWLCADFECGDLVAHSPFIVHASVNSATDLMRISADIRFVRTDGAIDPRWTKDWSADDGY